MIDHLSLQARDVDATVQFYLTVFAPIGIAEAMRFDRPEGPVVGLAVGEGIPQLWLGPLVDDGHRPIHLALSAGSVAEVDAVHEAAVAYGAEILHAARLWPEYHPYYYGAFFRDPDGNNVEAVYHQAGAA